MDPVTAVAAAGMRARMEALDLLANNLANVNTPGYKADREFYHLYTAAEAWEGPLRFPPSEMPSLDSQWTDYSQGSIQTTGSPLDLALHGEGFLAAERDGKVVYLRSGSFHVAPDGTVRTADGYALRKAGGGLIQVDPQAEVKIGMDGSVEQRGAVVGRLELTAFENPQALEKATGPYFRLADASEATKAATATRILQGRLEASNVTAAEAAIRLVTVMRQFESLQRALLIHSDMGRRSVEELARVSS